MKKIILSLIATVTMFGTAATGFAMTDPAYKNDKLTRRDIRENMAFSVNDRDRDLLAEITNNARTAQVTTDNNGGYKYLARSRRANLRRFARMNKNGRERYRILFYNEENVRDWIVGIDGVYSNKTAQVTWDKPTRRDIIKGAEYVRKEAHYKGIRSEWINSL